MRSGHLRGETEENHEETLSIVGNSAETRTKLLSEKRRQCHAHY